MSSLDWILTILGTMFLSQLLIKLFDHHKSKGNCDCSEILAMIDAPTSDAPPEVWIAYYQACGNVAAHMLEKDAKLEEKS